MPVFSKFYVISHPEYGYLGGNKRRTRFVKDIQHARKFYQRNFAVSCRNQRFRPGVADDYTVEEIQFVGLVM